MARRSFVITGVRIKLNNGIIDSFTASPVGMVTRFTGRVTRETMVEAAALTAAGTQQYGTGRMAKAYSTRIHKMGVRSCTFRMSNSRPYAAYVFRGTKPGPIFARGKRSMPVGKSQLGLPPRVKAPNAARFTYKRMVAGQKAKNYPMRAVTVVFARRRM